jgi:hypothetical protein
VTETTVESIFGVKPGIVWFEINKKWSKHHRQYSESNRLAARISLCCFGLAGHENKITVEQRIGQWSCQ